MQVLKSETLSREDLKLDAGKPTILLITDSPCIHSGLANACRKIWGPIHETGKFNIVQLGWWHRDPLEPSPWPLIVTNRRTQDQLDPQDHYGNVSLTKILPKIKPDLIWCFSPDTVAVTRAGIKLVKDLTTKDEVLSVAPDNGEVSYKRVVATQQREVDGEMVNIKARGVDFSVTPKHKLLLRRRFSKEYEFMTAEEVADHRVGTYKYFPEFRPVVGEVRPTFNILDHMSQQLRAETIVCAGKFAGTQSLREAEEWLLDHGVSTCAVGLWRPRAYLEIDEEESEFVDDAQFLHPFDSRAVSAIGVRFPLFVKDRAQTKIGNCMPVLWDMNDWLSLLGWYVSEGCKHSGNGIQITQKPNDDTPRATTSHRDDLEDLLRRMDIEYSSLEDSVVITSRTLAKWFAENCGHTAASKRLPDFVFDLDHTHLEYLFETMMLGDGHEDGSTYTTGSDQLRDDFLRLCFHLGKRCSFTTEQRRKERAKHPTWKPIHRIYITRSRNYASINHTHLCREKYSGPVYCCTVEGNHTLLAGRNGKFQFIGQCHGDPWMMIPIIARRPVIQCPIIAYLSVDGGPLDRDPFQRPAGVDPGRALPQQLGWHEAANNVDVVVPYLKWGHDMITDAFPGANVADPIPLGVDTSVFKPVCIKDAAIAKKTLLKVDDDAKVFISVSRNQLRKFLPYNFRALHFLREGRYSVCKCGMYNLWLRNYAFAKDIGPVAKCKFCGSNKLKAGVARENLYYYLHTPIEELMEDSWRLPPLMKHMGLMEGEESQCVFTNLKLKSVHGVSEKDLASYYTMCDAFALPSNEGFGLPFIEALACGLPVVAPNYSAHVDYLKGVADLVECPTLFCEAGTNYWRGLPDPDQWARALDEAVYMSPAEREMTRDRNRRVAAEYDWRSIWPRWIKLIEEAMTSKKESRMWSQIIRGV